MIDLTEAGRRLASTRVGPTPSANQLRAIGQRRKQHRRTIAAGTAIAAAAVVAAIALVVVSSGTHLQRVTTGPSPSQPSSVATLPPVHSVAGATPYDYQRLRLWLPAGWTTSTNTCHMATRVVYYPTNWSGGPATPCSHAGADIVVVRPFSGRPPGSATAKTVNGITVEVVREQNGSTTWYIPSLHAELAVSGKKAQGVADTLGPSTLQDLLTASLPTPVPTTWRTVSFDGFQARVPPTWPTHQIQVTRSGNSTEISDLPGVCAPPTFPTPSVYLGANPGISCPALPPTKEPSTDDGLWLQPSTNTAPLAAQLQGGAGVPGATQRLFTVGTEQVLITGAGEGDSVQAEIDNNGQQIAAVIGLGANPALAEALLSSIKPANR